MTPEERKEAYENSALKVLMESQGHEICPKCYCCDLVSDLVTCWSCGGFPFDEDDEFDTGCEECEGEGRIPIKTCIGRCDENGNHAQAGKP